MPTGPTARSRTCHRAHSPRHAAWVALAAISGNLLRAAGALACAKTRSATLRRDLINVAGRTARHGRGPLTVHLPEGWHRQQEWASLFRAATGPPGSGLTSPAWSPRPQWLRGPRQTATPHPRQESLDKPHKQ